MGRLSEVWTRLKALFGRGGMERDLEEEIAFHLAREEEKLVDGGMAPEEARRVARVRFGGVDRWTERTRESWGVRWLTDLGTDLRFAVRQLRRRPGVSGVAVLALGLAIGGTAAIFSVVDGLLLRPLPFEDEERIVVFWQDYWWRGAEFDLVRERARAYEELAAYSVDAVTLAPDDGALRMHTAGVVSSAFFDVLGARPLLGRTFREGEDRPGADPVAVLSHGLWRQEFGGDAGVVGRRVRMDGRSVTVVGVMPEGFFFPVPEVRLWTPVDLDPSTESYHGNGFLVLMGLVREGWGEARLREDVERITGALAGSFTYVENADRTRNAELRPVREYLLGDVRPTLLLLLGAVGVLLLIACVNVAALLLARTSDRRDELAVRAAIGAGRGRLVRQMLAEVLLLALAAGAVGAGVGAVGFGGLVALLPLRDFSTVVALDWSVAWGALALAALAGAAVSLAPIRGVAAGELRGMLPGGRQGAGTPGGSGGSGGRGGGGSHRLQRTLVAAEVLLAVTLVTGAALLVRSVSRLQAVDTGLDAEGVLVADLIAGAGAMPPVEFRRFLLDLVAEVEALPGVEAASVINRLPVRDGGWQGPATIEDRPDLGGPRRPNALWRTVTPAYFEALGVDVVRGRGFDATDREGALPVTIVNEGFARRMWPGQDPLGKRVRTPMQHDTLWRHVVGVAADVRMNGVRRDAPNVLYRPVGQLEYVTGRPTLVIRSSGDPTALAGTVRELVARRGPEVAVDRVMPMTAVLRRSLDEPLRLRFLLLLLSGLALLLGMVGVYGTVSYAVSRRTREMGIRMTLGARPGRLRSAVVGWALVPVAVGVAGGLAASLLLSRFLGHVLYGVAPTDPLSLALAAGALLAAAVVAAWLPARRASRVDPMRVLRTE